MVVKVKLQGFKELEQALSELPERVGKSTMRRTLMKVAEPLAAQMKAMAPDDPNTGGKDLKSSIGAGTRLSRNQSRLHRKMFKDDKASAEVFVGAGALPQAHMQEFGTSRHGPQPFARPAWDSQKGQMIDQIGETLSEEVMKAAKRVARKLAKAGG